MKKNLLLSIVVVLACHPIKAQSTFSLEKALGNFYKGAVKTITNNPWTCAIAGAGALGLATAAYIYKPYRLVVTDASGKETVFRFRTLQGAYKALDVENGTGKIYKKDKEILSMSRSYKKLTPEEAQQWTRENDAFFKQAFQSFSNLQQAISRSVNEFNDFYRHENPFR